ncbi:MAG: class II fumarate hydratase [Candidatus Bathyarchaeia archaeon]
MPFRVERDSIGEVRVPAEAYYGSQTQRALENFQVSPLRFPKRFIKAFAVVKLAAARANMRLGLLDKRLGDAIVQAAQELIEGKFDDQFPLDVFQTGSGTSTNMNVNEVIANRATELLGGRRGEKGLVHPNDHVNMAQSTNDVFPTVIHVAAVEALEQELLPALERLADALSRKAEEFKDVVKPGRTHLQDAVPITLGQEFSGYASMVEHGLRRVKNASASLRELAIGGTAVGTGLNAAPPFAELTVDEINALTGLDFRRAENPFEALQGRDAAVEASGALRGVAVSLMKVANDLRLLSSGPRTGLAEITLPPLQPGSSIMPGKVNPVIPEAVCMVAAQVIGNDVAITVAGQSGLLELNVMMPLIAYDLLQSIELEANAAKALAEKCVEGIRADEERCLSLAERSLALITAIAPKIGYDKAAEIAKEAAESDKSIREIVVEKGLMTEEEVGETLDLRRLAKGHEAN